jgi:hypothetical protein
MVTAEALIDTLLRFKRTRVLCGTAAVEWCQLLKSNRLHEILATVVETETTRNDFELRGYVEGACGRSRKRPYRAGPVIIGPSDLQSRIPIGGQRDRGW